MDTCAAQVKVRLRDGLLKLLFGKLSEHHYEAPPKTGVSDGYLIDGGDEFVSLR